MSTPDASASALATRAEAGSTVAAAVTPSLDRCRHSIFFDGPYDEDAMYRCVRCNHVYNHLAVTKAGTRYSHGCGEWVEIWPHKHAKCAHVVYHDGPHLGEVVTNHLPRKDYTAYVNRDA